MRRGIIGNGEELGAKASEAVVEEDEEEEESDARLEGPAFQVIVLGAGGGPNEDNVTALLVRSTATQWSKASVLAVDAGVHLSAITRILEQHMSSAVPMNTPATPISKKRWPMSAHRASWNQLPGYFSLPERRESGYRMSSPGIPEDAKALALTTGPFADLLVPHESAKANASWILRTLISTYLITHPHLDHLSGFVINTASFQHTSRPKKLAALPGTIEAIKTHLFNDVIWPNLSDEENGVGLVSYQRLVEGGNVALGEGEGLGYIEICEGLSVKAWTVSHGHCMKRHAHRSASQDRHGSDRRGSRSTVSPSSLGRRTSHAHVEAQAHLLANACIYDSSAYFIRDEETGKEVLIFGDVEPDAISLAPRTARVWADAAPKIAAGLLSGIFIECSYDDAQSDATLFGHLNPRHLIAELTTLAAKVVAVRRGEDPRASPPAQGSSSGQAYATSGASATPSRRHRTTTPPSLLAEQTRKRKRLSNGLAFASDSGSRTRRGRAAQRALRPTLARSGTGSIVSSLSPLSHPLADGRAARDASSGTEGLASTTAAHRGEQIATADPVVLATEMEMETKPLEQPLADGTLDGAVEWYGGAPLKGLRVVVIHVKETLRDGPPPGETILAQLREREAAMGLGCEFVLSAVGESIWL